MTTLPDDARLPERAERLLARWEQSDVHEVGAQRAGDAALDKILEGTMQSQPLAGLESPPLPQEPNEPSLSAAPSLPSSPSLPSPPGKPSSPSRPSLPAPPGVPSPGRPSNPMLSRGQDDIKLLEESLALSTRARRQVALSAPPPSSVTASAGPLRPSAAPPLRPSAAPLLRGSTALPRSMPGTAATAQASLPAPNPPAMAQPASAPQGILFPPVQRGRSGIGGLIAGVIGVTAVAAAAAAWLVVGRPRPAGEAARIAATPIAATTTSSVAAAQPASSVPETAPAQTGAEPEAIEKRAARPSAASGAGAHKSAVSPATPSAKAASADKSLAAAAPPAGPPSKGVPTWLKSAQGPTEKATSPAVAQEKESEGPSPGMKPADKGPNTDNLPTQPSHGAVQAAINAVMPGARRCVAGGKPVTANITFRGATGKVLSVSVGRGADKSAAACVRGALSGAKLSPFAKATFSSSATVRP